MKEVITEMTYFSALYNQFLETTIVDPGTKIEDRGSGTGDP